MSAVIEFRHLNKHYNSFLALNDLSFEVQAGEVFGLLGPNGAGKTTAIRVMNGLLPFSDGSVSVLGLSPVSQADQIRLHTGVLTETPSLYERLSARQNLEFSGRMWDLDGSVLSERVHILLDMFELSDRADDLVGTFSKGMKQRMALARALLPRPDILFLDEPTSGLDPESAHQVNSLIEQVSREHNQTVFLCTHLLHEAQRLCDRVAVLNQGRLLALGKPAELARDLFPDVQILLGIEQPTIPDLVGQISNLPWVKACQPVDVNELSITLISRSNIPELVASLVGMGVRIQKVEPREISLEEVYFTLQQKENGKRL